MRQLSAALVFLVAAATTGRTDWTITSAQIESRADGVQHRHAVLTNLETSAHAVIDLALFSTKSCTLRVIDQASAPRRDLAYVMQRENCLAGVNGGYFDSAYAPIGLLIVDEKTIAPLRRQQVGRIGR